MAPSLDINLLPAARYAGRDYPELLSLHAAEPPRRAARGREADRLILYLAVAGNAPLPPGKQDQVLADMAKLFFDTPGSVTAALRKVAEELNRLLLERNLHLTSSSRQGIGLLTQAVLRGSQLYLAVSGPVNIFLVTADEVQHFYDADMADRGLGQGRSTPVNFIQTGIQPNDTLIMAAQPAPGWSTETLQGLHGIGPESLRRRLFGQEIADLNAVLVQARSGKGAFYLPKPGKPVAAAPVQEGEQPSSIVAASVLAAPQPAATEIPASEPPMAEPPATVPPALEPLEPVLLEAASIHEGQPFPGAPPSPIVAPNVSPSTPAEATTTAVSSTGQAAQVPRASRLAVITAVLAQAIAPITAGLRRLGHALGSLLARMLPGDYFQSVPSTIMAFTALAVPVVVVTVSSVVYLRLGRDAQYETLYAQAEQIAQRSTGQTDVAHKHADIETALDLLSKAEAHRSSPEVQALQGQLRYALDELELIKRVTYLPAIIGGLPASVNITRMVVIEDDLYLLDSGRGSVIRATLTSQGYEVDLTFQCGPTSSGAVVDIAAWPPGYKPPARLLALDASGNILYCQPNAAPQQDRLTAPNTDAWGQIKAFSLDLGDSYVLDAPSKSVWIYWRSDFTQEPSMFFNDEIPDMQDVVDMTANRGDLYLLHADNRLTLCFYSDFQGVPTRCSDPQFVDFRPGRESLPLIPPAPFSQIQNTLPPDPSLYFLEPQDQAIYHFSLRNLAFQRMIAADNPLPDGNTTAFFVDNLQGYVYQAIGNQVFYAILP
jgi:hypothetical protein